jgi:hypothetical protein
LNHFEERYGPELRTILGLMLARETNKRIEWEQLSKLLENQQDNKSKVGQAVQRVTVVPHPAERVQPI